MTIDLVALAREVLPRDLWADFDRSLGTPQLGPYHHEGQFMGSPGSHLELILHAIEAVGRDEFHVDVPAGVRALMRSAATRYARIVPMYVDLHDVDKINCLTFVYTDGRKVAVSYAKWQEMLHDDPDGPAILARDGEALRRFCARWGIKQISYYQNLGGGSGRTHGKVTAQRLRGRREIPEIVARVIEIHEIAFQFKARGGLNLPLYQQTFRSWPEIEVGFAFLVNYADQMGSYTADGQPDIVSFVALARTFLAIPKFWEIHRQVMSEVGQINERAAECREALFAELWKSPTLLETESADESVRRIAADCTAPSPVRNPVSDGASRG